MPTLCAKNYVVHGGQRVRGVYASRVVDIHRSRGIYSVSCGLSELGISMLVYKIMGMLEYWNIGRFCRPLPLGDRRLKSNNLELPACSLTLLTSLVYSLSLPYLLTCFALLGSFVFAFIAQLGFALRGPNFFLQKNQ